MGCYPSKRIAPEPKTINYNISSSSDEDLLYDVPLEINELRILNKNRFCG